MNAELEERFLTDLQLFFSKSGDNPKSILQSDIMNDAPPFSQDGLYFLPYGCIGREYKDTRA